jgi:exosortase
MTVRVRQLEFFGFLAASIAVWYHPLTTLFKLALTSEAHTYLLIVLPLSIVLSYFRARDADPALPTSTGIGMVVLILALLLKLAADSNGGSFHTNYGLTVNIFALVMWWIGSMILCFGLSAFRTLFFPLVFLALMIPLPPPLLNSITHFLQEQSAVAAAFLFHLARVPVTRDGFVLSIPRLDIEVARECSSIRSSMLLVVSTLFLADLFLRSWWRKSALIIASIPLAVAKNGLRIFTIGELGTRVDPSFLDGRLHHEGGIVFLAVALAAVALLLRLLRQGEMLTAAQKEFTGIEPEQGRLNRRTRKNPPHSLWRVF